ncbi:YceI-like domain-containing protein [Hyunsoonleella jejuensis]|uniref:YceI-like domain-containing protein n=2 Tax=Hyunsoonleella jejuensis TaxID=419940 RepID=A0A1H9DMD4_9FLAO|nr:YceI-like domain-containing protein [Hyunsoonleella jejuensis]
MKRVLLFFIILIFFGFTYAEYANNTFVLIKPESKLVIHGKTNVNKFNCAYNVLTLQDPIPVYFELKGNRMVFKKTQLVLNNSCFSCGNKVMNKDFLKLLNSETYPNIIITLNEVESYAENDNIIQANVDIEIAGVVNSYTFPMQVNMYDTMQISGILDVNICDFNMKPPKKALGLVVVNEIIQIDFALQIKNQS